MERQLDRIEDKLDGMADWQLTVAKEMGGYNKHFVAVDKKLEDACENISDLQKSDRKWGGASMLLAVIAGWFGFQN